MVSLMGSRFIPQPIKKKIGFPLVPSPFPNGKGPSPLDSPERSMSLSQRAASKLIDKTCVPHDGVSWLFLLCNQNKPAPRSKEPKRGHQAETCNQKGGTPKKGAENWSASLGSPKLSPNRGSFQLRRPGAPHEGPELPRNETGKPLPNRSQLAYPRRRYPSKISQLGEWYQSHLGKRIKELYHLCCSLQPTWRMRRGFHGLGVPITRTTCSNHKFRVV